MQVLFAEATGSNQNLFSALGLDWQLLLVQTLAFLVLLWVLAKFVYPVLIRSIDERRRTIETGLEDAKKAHQELTRAEQKVETALTDARKEADGIIARSREEAAALLADAEAKAKTRAEAFLKDAQAQLDADIARARASLKKDTIELVALATEKIIDEKLDAEKDAQLIEKALAGKRAQS